jgi:integrase
MMKRPNPNNERVKRQYCTHLKEARGYADASIDKAIDAIARFEESTGFADFKTFSVKQATSFKRTFAQKKNRTGEPLSKATIGATHRGLKQFFHRLSDQPGFRSRISHSDADYFRLSVRDEQIARAQRPKAVPSLEQIERVITSMPSGTDGERRDRALVALLALTGARVSAIASLKLKHLDVAEGLLFQPGGEVRTKFGKTIPTWFFPVGELIRSIVEDYCIFLRTEKLFGSEDPLFPATLVANIDGRFCAVGISRKNWVSVNSIEDIVKDAFVAAGLPATTPHLFRDMLVLLGQRLCSTAEALKAWSQNLGHERVTTTLTSYGTVPAARQAAIMRELAITRGEAAEEIDQALALYRMVKTFSLPGGGEVRP